MKSFTTWCEIRSVNSDVNLYWKLGRSTVNMYSFPCSHVEPTTMTRMTMIRPRILISSWRTQMIFFFGFSGVFFFLSFATTKNGLWIGLHHFYSNIGFLSFSIVFLWYSVPQSYVYGSPYLGAATTAGTGLVPIQATQLSHAAAIAAATNQFYEYQVSL